LELKTDSYIVLLKLTMPSGYILKYLLSNVFKF
ncbi:hypothetical protein EV143_1352, partial [Flavobacterium chryseum]